MADAVMLVCVEGALQGQRFVIEERGLEIGRAEDNDIVLPDDGVSRQHARLQYDNGSLWLRDVGARNGVFVNDKRIGEHKDLKVGDRLRIGRAVFVVKWAQEAEDRGAPPAPKLKGSQSRTLVETSEAAPAPAPAAAPPAEEKPKSLLDRLFGR